jgi:hypothetical protein
MIYAITCPCESRAFVETLLSPNNHNEDDGRFLLSDEESFLNATIMDGNTENDNVINSFGEIPFRIICKCF